MRRVLSRPLDDRAPPLAFAVVRVPFFLESEYDESKPHICTNRERLVKKWGGKAGWERQKRAHDLKGRGRAAGIPHFNLDRLASNSLASHRLIQHVGKRYGLAASEALYDRLNVYYFVDGHALNDKPRLAKVAAATLAEFLPPRDDAARPAPMDAAEVLAFLNGTEGRVEIDRALRTLHELGIHGIPNFIVEGQSVASGAAGPDTFVRVFREIERRGEVRGGQLFGDMLGITRDTIARGSHTRESMLREDAG